MANQTNPREKQVPIDCSAEGLFNIPVGIGNLDISDLSILAGDCRPTSQVSQAGNTQYNPNGEYDTQSEFLGLPQE